MADDEKRKQNEAKARNLRNQASSKQSQIKTAENEVSTLENQISRLKTARNDMKDKQQYFDRNVRSVDRSTWKGRYKWEGSWYDISYLREMHRMYDLDDDFRKAVNRNIDKLNDKISELEKKKAAKQNWIMQLWAECKALWRQADNLLN